MTESEKKAILEKELSVNFLIQEVKKVITKGFASPLEIENLDIKIDGNLLTKGEIRYEEISTVYNVDHILKKIKELYEVYQHTKNEKIIEGVKEEILRLIALFLWELGVNEK